MKKFKSFIILLILAIILTGCNSSMAYTFTLPDKEKIKVELDISNGFMLKSADGDFAVQRKSDDILRGSFVGKEDINDILKKNIYSKEDAVIIDQNDSEINWQSEKGYNRITTVPGFGYYIFIKGAYNKELVDNANKALSFEVENGVEEELLIPDISPDTDTTNEDTNSDGNGGLLIPDGQVGDPYPDMSLNEDKVSYPEEATKREKEALAFAEDYMKMGGYNQKSLKKQLMDNDGFTEKEADYAINRI